jgi:hypothetical protein
VASVYASDVTASIAALPVDQQRVAKASLAGGLGIAERTGGASGQALADAVREAWMRGFRLSMMIAGAIVVAASVLAWAALPDSAHDHEVGDGHDDSDPVDLVDTVDDFDAAGPVGRVENVGPVGTVGARHASLPVTQAIPRS